MVCVRNPVQPTASMRSLIALCMRLWHFSGDGLPYQKASARQRQRDWTGLRSSPLRACLATQCPWVCWENRLPHTMARETQQPAGQSELWVAISLSPSLHLCSLSCENLLSVKLVESWFWGWTICLAPNGIHGLGGICINCSLQLEESTYFTVLSLCTFKQGCWPFHWRWGSFYFVLFFPNPLPSTLM